MYSASLLEDANYEDSEESDENEKEYDKKEGIVKKVIKIQDIKMKVKGYVVDHQLDKSYEK